MLSVLTMNLGPNIYTLHMPRQCALLPSFSFHGSSISVQHHSTFDSQKQLDIPIVQTLL
jgi:hypothetical protein